MEYIGLLCLVVWTVSLLVIAALYYVAPEGYEDEDGFHYGARR